MIKWFPRGDTTDPVNCRQVARVLQSYLDGELDGAATQQVRHHLEDCRRCGLEAETYEAITSALARREQSPPEAVERLRAFGESLLSSEEPG